MITALNFVQRDKHLPPFMRDFHDQKALFKAIHNEYDLNDNKKCPNWIQAHIYTIDIFLWYMGQRGYTLQKSRADVEFKSL